MSKKNVNTYHKRSSALMITAKIIMLLMSLYFSCAMPVLTGAGLLSNRESYGESLAVTGSLFIVSAVLMTAGAVLCLFRKPAMNKLSALLSVSGFVLCMVMLNRLTAHADASGWTNKYTLEPVSSMYDSRILPCIAPVAIATVIASVQLFSRED